MATIEIARSAKDRPNEGDYKPNIIIIGQSGSGKTSSLRNLPKDDNSIHFIELEHKGLPFKGRFCNTKCPSTVEECLKDMEDSHNDTGCKTIIMEGLTKYCEYSLEQSRRNFKGYDIFTNHTSNIVRLMKLCKSRSKTIILTAIDDFVQVFSPSGAQSTVRRASVGQGKEWEGKIEKEFTIALFTDVKDGGKHGFITNSNGICQAKSPIGMFQAGTVIDNDIAAVLKKMEEYFK